MTLDNIKTLEPAKLRTEMESLKKAGFDYLVNLVGMDWGEEGGLGVVYELENTETHATTWLKTSTADRENPMLPTVSDIWQIANIYEREVFDFYGIKFVDHPDMRRIFLREDWVGYPMRKDDKPEEQNPLNMTNEPLADTTTQYILNPDGTITVGSGVGSGPKTNSS